MFSFLSFYVFFFLFIHFIVFMNFCLNFSGFLTSMILIEFLVLNLFVVFFYLLINSLNFFLLVYFLVIVVCEGALGLGVLVSMVRLGGSSLFNQSNFCLC